MFIYRLALLLGVAKHQDLPPKLERAVKKFIGLNAKNPPSPEEAIVYEGLRKLVYDAYMHGYSDACEMADIALRLCGVKR